MVVGGVGNRNVVNGGDGGDRFCKGGYFIV